MVSFNLIKISANNFELSGDVVLASAASLVKIGKKMLPKNIAEVRLNITNLHKIDVSTISVFLEWRRSGINLSLSDNNEQFISLLKSYKIENVFNFYESQ